MSDIRSALESAFAEAGQEVQTQTAPVEQNTDQQFDAAKEQSEPVKLESGKEPTAAERARDQKGRFAEDKQKSAKVDAAVSPTKRKPPSSWKPDVAAKWDNLDETLQEEILRRESDYHKSIQQWKPSIEQAQAVHKAIEPYAATIRAAGVTPIQAVQHLFDLDHKLRYGNQTQKMDVVRYVMESAGLDATSIFGERQQEAPEIVELRNQLQNMEKRYNEIAQVANRQDMQQVQAVLSDYSSKPHFEDVRLRMADLIEAHAATGKELTIDKAYEMAVWENPQIRQQLIEEQISEADKTRRQQAQVQRSRQASVSVTGAPNGAPSNTVRSGSIRTALQDAVRLHRG